MKILPLLLLCSSASAATFYIDFSSGSDVNSGLNTSNAWKTIPGTRTSTDWYHTSWGLTTITSGNKVPAGTIFKLKSGTTYGTNIAGKIHIDSTFYSGPSTANPVSFIRDTTWGSGPVVFEGTGIDLSSDTGQALISVLNQGGYLFDGITTNGIIIRNSQRIGLKQYLSGISVLYADGLVIRNIQFTNNGTLYASNQGAGAGSGQLAIGGENSGTIGTTEVTGCEFSGNYLYFNGLNFGQSHLRVINATVANCTAHHHLPDVNDDTGIGFKAQNCQATFTNVVGYWNGKGLDLGEEEAADVWPITYKVLGSLVYSNGLIGIGLSGSQRVTQTTNVNFYIINTIVRDGMGGPGIKGYSSPFNLWVIGCTLENNIPNILAHHDGITETNGPVRAHFYNNILFKPFFYSNDGWANLDIGYWADVFATSGVGRDVYILDSDYNCYVSTATTQFSLIGSYGGGSDVHTFNYGSDGPGHFSGAWYNFGGWHNDAHSVGSGSGISTNWPPFAGDRDYRLTATYPGVNLSSKPWYISEMGVDRLGMTRVNWDMGAYEFNGTVVAVSGRLVGSGILKGNGILK